MRRALLTLSFAMLIACSERTSGGSQADEFTAALNAYYADNPECVRVGRPADEDGVVAEIKLSLLNRDPDLPKLDALAQAGVLTVQDVEVETPGQLGLPSTREAVRRYTLTSEGEVSLRAETGRRDFRRGATELCYGHREVASVLRSMQPPQATGEHVASVAYAYQLNSVADWARYEAVAAAFPTVSRSIDGPNEDTDELVLTSDGWVHHRLAP